MYHGKDSEGNRRRVSRGDLAVYVFLGIGIIINLIPLLWMISASLKAPNEIFAANWLPDDWQFANYAKVFSLIPFGRFYLNSVLVAFGVTAVTVVLSSTAGYAFAKLPFPGRRVLFVVFLSTLMVPFHVNIIPLYKIVTALGWLDTYAGLILPQVALGFAVFLMRQFMLSVPDDILDAAKVDGSSALRTFWRIVLPIQRPALATVGIFSFTTAWNNLLWPLIASTSPGMRTLPVGLGLFSTSTSVDWSLLMAGSTLTILPVLMVFFLLQKQFIRGLTSGAVKE